jgi:DNA sulfur modification protein DndD
MHLKRVDIQNFRVFYGAHTIDLAYEKANSVTIFHGENGAGKTTFLNAIYWCLTGKLTPGVENKEVINENAQSEGDGFECFVEISFEHDGKEYRFKRGIEYGRPICQLILIQEDGNHIPFKGDGERFIQKIIPRELMKWFFFDGEAIKAFSLGSSDFKKNLRETLGFLFVDKLKLDLGIAFAKMQKKMSDSVKDNEIKEKQKDLDRVNSVMPGLHDRKDSILIQEEQCEIDLDRIEKKLSDMPKVGDLQKRRSLLEREKNNLESEKNSTQTAIINHLSTCSFPIFLNEDAKHLEEIFEIKEIEGKLPAPYSNQLVEDIIKNGKCICGREVNHNSIEEHEINKLLEFANTTELNFRLTQARYLIQDIRGLTNAFLPALEKLRGKVSQIDSKIAEVDENIAEVSTTISQSDVLEIRRLEDDRNLLKNQYKKLCAERLMFDANILNNKKTILELGSKIEILSKKLGGNKKLQREIDKLKRIIFVVEKNSSKQEAQVFDILTNELNNSLEKYLTKNYKAKIDPESYKVVLTNEEGRPVKEGTGEGQILKFAFVSTLIAIAAKKTKEQIDFLVEPTVAPLVLDAPFSVLDPTYARSLAKGLANNVDQLILLANSSGWNSIESGLKNHIGKQYLIIQRAMGPRHGKDIKTITVNEKLYELNEYDSERDDSYFKEIFSS